VGVSKALRSGIFTRQGNHPARHWAVELSGCAILFTAVRRGSFFLIIFTIHVRGCCVLQQPVHYAKVSKPDFRPVVSYETSTVEFRSSRNRYNAPVVGTRSLISYPIDAPPSSGTFRRPDNVTSGALLPRRCVSRSIAR